jgi:hypothetical protein
MPHRFNVNGCRHSEHQECYFCPFNPFYELLFDSTKPPVRFSPTHVVEQWVKYPRCSYYFAIHHLKPRDIITASNRNSGIWLLMISNYPCIQPLHRVLPAGTLLLLDIRCEAFTSLVKPSQIANISKKRKRIAIAYDIAGIPIPSTSIDTEESVNTSTFIQVRGWSNA